MITETESKINTVGKTKIGIMEYSFSQSTLEQVTYHIDILFKENL